MDVQSPPPHSTTERPRATRPPAWKRVLRGALLTKLALVMLLLAIAGGLYGRLLVAPFSLASYSGSVATALAERIGPGWTVRLGDTTLQIVDARPAVTALGIEIRNPAGILVVKAPAATVSLDGRSVLSGKLVPREVELRDLQLRVHLAPDGSLSFVAPTDTPEGTAAPRPVTAGQAADDAAPSVVAHAVTSLLDPIIRPTSLVGALDRAAVVGAHVTLIGADGRERLAFGRVDALFTRMDDGGRKLDIGMEGPRGAWHVTGEVRDRDGRRSAEITAADVPLDDVLLLAGLAPKPTGSDLKLSAEMRTELVEGRLRELGGRFTAGAGLLARPDGPPLRIDSLSGQAVWREADRRLDLPDVSVRCAVGEVTLAGSVAAGADGRWDVRLAGRDATVAGATVSDRPFRIAGIDLVAFVEGGMPVLDRLTMKGEELDLSIAGSSIASADGTGLRLSVAARDSSVRRLLALWPDTVNPELRGYLSTNFRAGAVDRLDLKAELDPADMRNAFSGKPISDRALAVTVAVSGGRVQVVDGLPPLRGLAFTGRATGTATFLNGQRGFLEVSDGRRLNFLDSSFAHTDEDKPGSLAQIGFRLQGNADAVAALLQSPALREASPGHLDPATVKGKADLKVTLALDVHHLQAIRDMPIGVAGTFTELSVDRVAGREKLEGATASLLFEAGALALKGEGRVGGSPATFDLRQPRSGPGEARVDLTLDDAARTRRSLPSGPQVTGPVAVKIVAPLGAGGKTPTRLEADLGRVAIDGLLPGWTKPSGRPGRLAFNLGEGDGFDLRDLVLDSGSVQIRGHAQFSGEGQLEKAEFPTFKLSPGDELAARVERAGNAYRIGLKGNNGDARPVLRWIGGGSGGSGGPKGRDPPDLDVDAAVNIVTGHNDEALTGVTARISTRGRDLRSLQIRGQFRSASLEAETSRRDGAPALILRSSDAGATLRFLDLYKRMWGGKLDVETTTGDTQSGSISIGGFGIRNEPALRRITAQSTDLGGTDERGGSRARMEVDQVDFVRLTAEFKRAGARTDYKDVTIWGPQVGFNLNGYVDGARDRMDVSGTFVPAYGLNNMFSQVPVVGILLGGGRNEGLIAIDFRVAGPTNAPSLTVNPLTAVAPGILRKLFGWMMPEDESTGATTVLPRQKSPAARPPRARPAP